MRIELEHYEKIEGEALELDGKANKLSQMIRANLPAAMQGLVVVPLFAGYDLRRKLGPALEVRRDRRPLRGGRLRGHRLGRALRAASRSRRPTGAASRARTACEIAVAALEDAADEDRAHRRHRHRARHLPDRELLLRARASSARPRPRSSRSTSADPRARAAAARVQAMSMPVLRLARTGHAGQGRLRPQGHRPRQVQRHPRVCRAASC